MLALITRVRVSRYEGMWADDEMNGYGVEKLGRQAGT